MRVISNKETDAIKNRRWNAMKNISKFFFFHTIKQPTIDLTTAVGIGEYDENTHTININPHLPLQEFKETLIHEFIHACWKVDHGYLSRKVSYYSNKNTDYLSRWLHNIIFKKVKR